jgi:hypothetical protein
MRDVIKAAADAAGAGKITADEAITLISQMPQDQDKLRPWLRQMYAFQFTAAIHLKAEMMAEAQAQQQGAQPAQAMPPGAPGQAAAPQPTQVMPPQAAPAVNPQGPMP